VVVVVVSTAEVAPDVVDPVGEVGVLPAEVVAEAAVTAVESPVQAETLRMTAPASIANGPRLAGLITPPGPTRKG
jgi:hypothetical protein